MEEQTLSPLPRAGTWGMSLSHPCAGRSSRPPQGHRGKGLKFLLELQLFPMETRIGRAGASGISHWVSCIGSVRGEKPLFEVINTAMGLFPLPDPRECSALSPASERGANGAAAPSCSSTGHRWSYDCRLLSHRLPGTCVSCSHFSSLPGSVNHTS